MRILNIGDAIVHKSDKKPRKMVIAAICEDTPDNLFAERVRLGIIRSGSFYCTWISGAKKGEGIFLADEIEHQLDK